ncbi:hypothetical protein C343_06367 [Cryptococcus neoformans C23]|uniref:Uncharacterized protein n=2 Tax=Cryptococcus neoformans TaxID=5207 RepID=A0A854Q396_CRYNE|nr:hypothetical protein CNAG_06162 [Cryptococcus neoformans var. grubii H99]AUB28530.1 hypothetical protein CKF44_06162 [Cryptococcus neoformans var. grubii]OWZ27197.1 hypothetical protein C347_06367 [Cryptococcus neoformans var. grubii AD2-60a]OWZ28823.1 hypothetical protein C353_06390 [Cryptococcus neoformans var. grubii AD1-83a]OWZ39159.1 hypothetical protein C343_06367 [Cryptococcus neoformans var. grubii C23]OXC81560.1 hypothetical protein C344_06271 [Cryptococcus neoformans var. grubii A|eukprot:XP_012053177.1 hypothetical protein CNAG_06162 [Cryptococcus neoformans var. grubii H99]
MSAHPSVSTYNLSIDSPVTTRRDVTAPKTLQTGNARLRIDPESISLTPSSIFTQSPTAMQSSPSPLFTTSTGWQLPPNTPSPPPPYRSPFATHRTAANVDSCSRLKSTRGMRRQSNPFQSLHSSKQGRKWEEKKFGKVTVSLGVGLGVEVEREMQDAEMERVLEMADDQSKVLLKKRLEEMRIHVEQQVRAESCQRITQLENALADAHQTIRRLEKEKLVLEDTMKEVEERITVEYQLAIKASERPRPSGLRPLGLLSKARPASVSFDGKQTISKGQSMTSMPVPDPSIKRLSVSRHSGIPYRASTLPANLPSTPLPASPDALSSAADSSLCTPIDSPTQCPTSPSTSSSRPRLYRLSQMFTCLSSNSVNARAYEELEMLADSPKKGNLFEAESEAADKVMTTTLENEQTKRESMLQRRTRPRTMYDWSPPIMKEVSPSKQGDCPITITYNKLVGRPSLPPTLHHNTVDTPQSTFSAYKPFTSPDTDKYHHGHHCSKRAYEDEEDEDDYDHGYHTLPNSLTRPHNHSTRMIRARKRLSVNGAGHDSEPGDRSLLEGYRATQRKIHRRTQMVGRVDDINRDRGGGNPFIVSLSSDSTPSPQTSSPQLHSNSDSVSPSSERKLTTRNQQYHLQTHPQTRALDNPYQANPRQMACLLGTIAKCSGWMTVVGFAGLTVGGWMKK